MANNQSVTSGSSKLLNVTNDFSVWRIVLVALAIFLAAGLLWWRAVYANPRRVFESMLDNSLRLQGVTKQVTQTDNGQNVNQTTYLSLGAKPAAQSKTVLTQPGNDSTTVVTESIGTPMADYVRYTSINTSQTKESGEPLDFKSVLNVWGSSEASQPGPQTDGELYNESVLGVIPFGSLDKHQRQELLDLIRSENIYEVDYTNVDKKLENGRPRYSYNVTVDAQAYIQLLKRFGEMSGLNHLSEIDPASYASSDRLPFVLTVDVWSHELQKIKYGNGERVEIMSGHNAVKNVSVPENVIGVDELQTRLQNVQ